MDQNRPEPVVVRSQSRLFQLITRDELGAHEEQNENHNLKKISSPSRRIEGATKN